MYNNQYTNTQNDKKYSQYFNLLKRGLTDRQKQNKEVLMCLLQSRGDTTRAFKECTT